MFESLHLSPFVIAPLAVAVVLVLVLLAVGKVPLGYNIRNLLVRWWITFLTAFAFTLVVGLLTVMLAFVNGMYRLTENSGNPGNVMILSDGATDELFSNLAKSDTTNIERQKGVARAKLRDDDQQEREYPLCSKEVYIVVNQPIPPPGPRKIDWITALFAWFHVSPKTVAPLAGGIFLLALLLGVGLIPLGDRMRNLFASWRIASWTVLGFIEVISLIAVVLAGINILNPPGEKGPEFRGKIKSISTGTNEFSVTDLKDAEMTFHPAENPKFNINTLKVDDVVVVDYEKNAQGLLASNVRVSKRRRFVQVRGIEDHRISSQVHDMQLFPEGKWWGSAGVQDAPGTATGKGTLPLIQAVLGEGVARILGQDQDKDGLEIGDTFELGPRKWIVTGIMRSAGSTFGSEIWAKHSIVGPMFGKDQFTCLVVRTQDATGAEQMGSFLSKDYRPAVRAEPETVYYEKLSETNKQFSIAIYFVTIIMAIGGVFGVMNTMFAAISQRTKDIGMLRILGFARWQILVSFFLETLVLAMVGGLMGCAAAYILFDGATATSIVSSGQGGGKTVVLKLIVDTNTIGKGVIFTLIMGALGGLVPALSAMRLRPLESLR